MHRNFHCYYIVHLNELWKNVLVSVFHIYTQIFAQWSLVEESNATHDSKS